MTAISSNPYGASNQSREPRSRTQAATSAAAKTPTAPARRRSRSRRKTRPIKISRKPGPAIRGGRKRSGRKRSFELLPKTANPRRSAAADPITNTPRPAQITARRGPLRTTATVRPPPPRRSNASSRLDSHIASLVPGLGKATSGNAHRIASATTTTTVATRPVGLATELPLRHFLVDRHVGQVVGSAVLLSRHVPDIEGHPV